MTELRRWSESDRNGARPDVEPWGDHAAAASRESTPATQRPRLRTVESEALLGLDGILGIEHGGEIYTLRRTRNGRLILTK
jgi:hemin uptake protein HemP